MVICRNVDTLCVKHVSKPLEISKHFKFSHQLWNFIINLPLLKIVQYKFYEKLHIRDCKRYAYVLDFFFEKFDFMAQPNKAETAKKTLLVPWDSFLYRFDCIGYLQANYWKLVFIFSYFRKKNWHSSSSQFYNSSFFNFSSSKSIIF